MKCRKTVVTDHRNVFMGLTRHKISRRAKNPRRATPESEAKGRLAVGCSAWLDLLATYQIYVFDHAGLPFGGVEWRRDVGLLCDGSPQGWREIVSRISSDLDAFLRKRGDQSCSHRIHARRDGTRLLPSQDQPAPRAVSAAESAREPGKCRVAQQGQPIRQQKQVARHHGRSQ